MLYCITRRDLMRLDSTAGGPGRGYRLWCSGWKTPTADLAFLDAAGTCLILVKRDLPINPVLDDHGGVHHSFVIAHEGYPAALDHLRAHDVEITFEEDRQGGVLNGPRAYFHDPDRTVLEFI